MTSTVLPPATASAPMARAMFPVPMMLMLFMSVLSSAVSIFRFVPLVPGGRWPGWVTLGFGRVRPEMADPEVSATAARPVR